MANAGEEKRQLIRTGRIRFMKGLLLSAAVGAAALFSVSAQALPVSSSQAASSAISSDIIQVAEGCGRGYHRGPGGRCHRNLSAAHGACWWVRGPGGAWRMICK
jgi:hypothetical protein